MMIKLIGKKSFGKTGVVVTKEDQYFQLTANDEGREIDFGKN